VELGVIILFALFAILKMQTFFSKTNIQVQKNISMLYWALLIASASFIYQENIDFGHLLIFAVPLSVFLAFTFGTIKNKALAEVLHAAFILIILILQYRVYLGTIF
jgi:hypothetical protein